MGSGVHRVYRVCQYKEGKQRRSVEFNKKCGKEIAMGTSVPLLIPLEGTGGKGGQAGTAGAKTKYKNK